MKKHVKIVLILIVVGALVGLLFTTIKTQTGYDLEVSDVVKQKPTLGNKYIRLEGNIDQSTAKWDAKNLLLTFDVIGGPGISKNKKADPKAFPNADRLTIVFKGPRPDNFEEAITAIVEGTINNKGQFAAEKLMVKCPSKYETKSKPQKQ